MPPPLPAHAAHPRRYRAGGVGGRAPYGRTPPDPVSAFVCPLPACAGGGGGSCAQRALPTPRPSGVGLFFFIMRPIGNEPTTENLPRRAHHGEHTTKCLPRRTYHGEPNYRPTRRGIFRLCSMVQKSSTSIFFIPRSKIENNVYPTRKPRKADYEIKKQYFMSFLIS
jgi:hypothetical protein